MPTATISMLTARMPSLATPQAYSICAQDRELPSILTTATMRRATTRRTPSTALVLTVTRLLMRLHKQKSMQKRLLLSAR